MNSTPGIEIDVVFSELQDKCTAEGLDRGTGWKDTGRGMDLREGEREKRKAEVTTAGSSIGPDDGVSRAWWGHILWKGFPVLEKIFLSFMQIIYPA